MPPVPQVPVQQLICWLNEARNALHQIEIGRRSVEVMADGYMVKYSRANIADLKAYIRDLEAKIEGRRVGGAIVPIF